MSPTRTDRPAGAIGVLLIAILAAFTAAVCAVAILTIRTTDAAWTTTKSDAVTVTAVTPVVPSGFACDNASGVLVTSIGFHWTAVPATGTAPAPTAYRLVVTNNATSAQTLVDPTATSTTQSIGGSVLTVGGSYTVSVQSRYGDAGGGAWYSASSTTRTLTVSLGALGLIVSYNCG